MAVLQSARGELRVPCRAVVGRSSLADIQLASRRASSEHASLGWCGGRWTLRDLGSSNGTTVNGRPLLTRDRATLTPGSRICFGGDEESWLLTDTAPPEPCAVLLGPQSYAWGQHGLLVLGGGAGDDEPEASIFLDGDVWQLDDGATVTTPECGEIAYLRSGYWRLLLPDVGGGGDAVTAGRDLDMARIELTFTVSLGQLMSLTITQDGQQLRLPARAHFNTLWELARRRAADSAPDAGWVSAFDVAAKLKCSPEKVNVDIHRLRRLFQESGVHQAARIIERDDAKRIRIGVSQIKITTQ